MFDFGKGKEKDQSVNQTNCFNSFIYVGISLVGTSSASVMYKKIKVHISVGKPNQNG